MYHMYHIIIPTGNNTNRCNAEVEEIKSGVKIQGTATLIGPALGAQNFQSWEFIPNQGNNLVLRIGDIIEFTLYHIGGLTTKHKANIEAIFSNQNYFAIDYQLNDISGNNPKNLATESMQHLSPKYKVLDFTCLLPGDVLLYRIKQANLNSLEEKIIESTNSPYTHASIYIGDGKIAEVFSNVQKSDVWENIGNCECIGVIRDKEGNFDTSRMNTLKNYIEELEANGGKFDFKGLININDNKKYFNDYHMEILNNSFGNVTTKEKYAQKSYFCSSFVVTCFIVTKIIGDSAQPLFPENTFSPADLYRDLGQTFGLFLGYLLPKDSSIPHDDPLKSLSHTWANTHFSKWWEK